MFVSENGAIGAAKKGGPRWHPRGRPPPYVSNSMVTSIAEEVKTHTEKIEQGQAILYAQACPRCGRNQGFGRHQIRRREFRIIVDGWVRLIPSWICRWKCKACGKTFTDYPPFHSRRKAAATPSIPSNNSLTPISTPRPPTATPAVKGGGRSSTTTVHHRQSRHLWPSAVPPWLAARSGGGSVFSGRCPRRPPK